MRLLSLDFGTWSLKAAELESRFRRLDILDFHEVRLPNNGSEPAAAYKAALDQILSRLPSHPERILASLPPSGTSLRFLPFPLKQRKKVEQMYRFELEDTVPFKLDDAIVEHHYFKTNSGSLILAAIAPKPNIAKQLAWLQSAGLEADWISFDGMGLMNLALSIAEEFGEDEEPKGPIAFLDLGHQKSNLVVMDKGVIQYFRTLSWGGASLTRTIAMNLSLSLEAAEEQKIKSLKLTASPNTEDELTASAVQGLSPCLTELNHNFATYRNLHKQDIWEIHLVGGTALLPGLTEYLEAKTGVNTKRAQPFEYLDVKSELKKYQAERFAEVWGSALAIGRKAPILFNFRKEELAKQTSLTEVKEVLANPHIQKLAQYLGILAALLLIHVNVAGFLASRELISSNDELKKVFQDTFRTVPQKLRSGLLASPEQLRKFIEQKNRELEQKLQMLAHTKTPMIGLIRQISAAFPPGVRVDVNELLIDDRSFSLKGVLYEGNLATVTDNLNKIPSFSSVVLQPDGQRFTYLGKVAGR